jgi:hypothetical protein
MHRPYLNLLRMKLYELVMEQPNNTSIGDLWPPTRNIGIISMFLTITICLRDCNMVVIRKKVP